MGKLKCKCGHVIVDQSDNLEYKGYVLPDIYFYNFSDMLTNNIDSLIEATNNGTRLEWIKKHFKVPPYPTDIKDSSMINDLLDKEGITRQIYECENCGRIAIQAENINEYKFFTPDSENTKGILKRGSEK